MKKESHSTIVKNKKYVVKLCATILLCYCVLGFTGIAIAHAAVFMRVDYDGYDSGWYLVHADLDAAKYPRHEVTISSGVNKLQAYIYTAENPKGVIVVSPGLTDASDIKLYETIFFIDAGWTVLCYDYTGCYKSEGSSMMGYTQSVYDLNAVLDFVEAYDMFDGLSVMLFGHSLGAYASAAVLQFDHDIAAAIVASGFDTPAEQWRYSIKRYTGVFSYLLAPSTEAYIGLHYGRDAYLSAVDGINATDIPVLVISGTDDEYYGGESQIYKKRGEITNENCVFRLMERENHNGHYDYFLSDDAIAYREEVHNDEYVGSKDKELYMEHDPAFMEYLIAFFASALGH